MGAHRWLVAIAATVVLIAVSVLVVALRPATSRAACDPGTPGETVRRSVAAVVDHDPLATRAPFDADLAEARTSATFAPAAGGCVDRGHRLVGGGGVFRGRRGDTA